MSERFEFLAVFSSLVPTGGRLRGGSGVLFLCLARTFRRGFLLDIVFSQMRTVFWPKALSVRTWSAFFLLLVERTKLEKTAGIWRKTLLAGFGRKGWWRGVCSLGSACARFCGPPCSTPAQLMVLSALRSVRLRDLGPILWFALRGFAACPMARPSMSVARG